MSNQAPKAVNQVSNHDVVSLLRSSRDHVGGGSNAELQTRRAALLPIAFIERGNQLRAVLISKLCRICPYQPSPKARGPGLHAATQRVCRKVWRRRDRSIPASASSRHEQP